MEDPGSLVQMGFSAGSRSAPQFDWVRNITNCIIASYPRVLWMSWITDPAPFLPSSGIYAGTSCLARSWTTLTTFSTSSIWCGCRPKKVLQKNLLPRTRRKVTTWFKLARPNLYSAMLKWHHLLVSALRTMLGNDVLPLLFCRC